MSKFYVENGVGKRVTDAINLFTENHGWTASVQHDVHPQMQIAQEGDEWWIEEATDDGYVILTRDLEIFRTQAERETVVRTKARVIGFAKVKYTGWDMIGGLAFHWPTIEEHLEEAGPWILKVYKGSTAPKLLLGETL